MKNMQKGTRGYINARKKFALICTLVSFGVAAGVFVLGLFLNNFEKGNVFTIIAAVLVIPAAKFVVSLFMFVPYKTVPEDQYKRVCEVVKEEDVFWTDVVMTSYEHVLNMAYLVIAGDKVFILEGRDREKWDFTRDYLQTTIKKKGYDLTVTVFEAHEEQKFIKSVKQASRFCERGYSEEEVSSLLAERAELTELLETLMV